MLLVPINDEIRRRKRENESQEELFIECPLPFADDQDPDSPPSDDIEGDRGIAILDFDI